MLHHRVHAEADPHMKNYESPSLTKYGDIDEVTQGGDLMGTGDTFGRGSLSAVTS